MRAFVPNVVTSINLLFAFLSVLESFKGNFGGAASFILIGLFIDMLDGKLARLLDAESAFGRELDSLSDVCLFGLAPSVLLYQRYFGIIFETGALICVVPFVCSALRLARFNISEKRDDFEGLPAPAAALLTGGYSLTSVENYTILIALIVTSSLLMVSHIPYPSCLKSRSAWVTCAMGLLFSYLLFREAAPLMWAMAYTLFGFARYALQVRSRRPANAVRLARELPSRVG
jgi:CDP-diacylglycerol---serine O-phosphatidyltransferase